jgi:hypothetical protein
MASLLNIPFVPENFSYIANKILNNLIFIIMGIPHRICEIEFYLNSNRHQDLYIHGHTDQTIKGSWYFHRFNTGTYKNGTFKGMDIVLGSKVENKTARSSNDGSQSMSTIYGAILVRSIININTNTNVLIEGPCKTVDYILQQYKVDNISALTNNASLNILDNNKGLVLIDVENLPSESILHGPRIGLSDKYPDYRDRKYRFVIGSVKKEKKKLIPLNYDVLNQRIILITSQ